MSELLLDRAGRRRSPATLPGFHAGQAPGNKGLRYPADPPKVEEIVGVMRSAGDDAHGRRLRGLIVVMWRAGLRVQEALALTEGDLDQRRGSLLIRRGKGGRRREVGMDAWGWEQLQPWREIRRELPVGPLLCVINGTTRGRHWSSAAARAELRRTAAAAGVRRRFAPHQLRHAPRRRDGSRGGAPERHPAATRPQQPRHHQRLPARDRQRRDHRDRARPTGPDDPRERLAAALIDCECGAARRAKRQRAQGQASRACLDSGTTGNERSRPSLEGPGVSERNVDFEAALARSGLTASRAVYGLQAGRSTQRCRRFEVGVG